MTQSRVTIVLFLMWGLKRGMRFSAQVGEGLARFVFDFAIPALLLRTFANADLPDDMPLDPIGSYYLAGAF
jgi:predicted permease